MYRQLIAWLAVGAGLACTLSPTAAASETISVQEICSYFGGQPYDKLGQGLVCSTTASTFVAGNPIADAVKIRWPDAYPVDPANIWSDWVLPGGRASAAPPKIGYWPGSVA